MNQHICGRYSGCPYGIPDALPSGRVLKNLPEKFTNLKPGYLPPKVPMCKVNSSGKASASKDFELLRDCLNEDHKWLEHVQDSDLVNLSWAAYHATRATEKKQHPNLLALLLVWRDDSKLRAMIKHSLDVVKDPVVYLNPGQTPVIAFEQPLFALAKKIQWHHLVPMVNL